MRWSVRLEAEGDRVMTREEIVEFADAVAAHGGVASGIGTTRYGARLAVEAGDREEAVRTARAQFARAAERAGLPPWPIAGVGVSGEHDEDAEDDEDPGYPA